MRIFVKKGKGNKERYTILPKASLEMLRKYWKERPKVKAEKIFLDECKKPINQYVIRTHFRKYRRKAKLDEKLTVHTLRHCYATNLIENGASLNTTNNYYSRRYALTAKQKKILSLFSINEQYIDNIIKEFNDSLTK